MIPALLDILTPQGYLSEIQQAPNLDVLMNLFKIPRAFTVSGFGHWTVGMHSACAAFLALYWSEFRGYDEAQRNTLMVLALTHDLHESATGDILPGLKNPDLRTRLKEIQSTFLQSLQIQEDPAWEVDLKILDIVAFLYEIQQAQTLNHEQKQRLQVFLEKQRILLMDFCQEHQVLHIEKFLAKLGLFPEKT